MTESKRTRSNNPRAPSHRVPRSPSGRPVRVTSLHLGPIGSTLRKFWSSNSHDSREDKESPRRQPRRDSPPQGAVVVVLENVQKNGVGQCVRGKLGTPHLWAVAIASDDFFLFHLRRVHSKPWICEIADIVEGASVFGVVWGFIFCWGWLRGGTCFSNGRFTFTQSGIVSWLPYDGLGLVFHVFVCES
jgi:hypothetical protein